ncbi:hypothetical protein PVAND_016855 [Polypedilum vanderplanki]|uniref:Uncharacterized protein n=1 Tax=Polypedilum vanderplanki TaxID=319348 RepID=A0A9J6BGM3_POLVA|nr:hypothetical protein PVAND_016855 [Polypedilum vanderplanki]
MLFEFMTSDMRKQLPSSIEDLKEMNYTIVLEKSLTNYCERLNEEIINSRQRPNIIRVDRFEFNDLYKKALKEENKMKFAFLIDDISHANLNSTFKNSLQKMHNEKLLKMVGYSTNRNMLMQRQFDEILEKLIPSGITKYSGDYGKWLNFRPVDFEVKDSRRILSLTDLEFGFVIWLVSLSLPIACFLIEISIEYCRKIKKIVETFITSRFVEIILEVFMSY